MIFKIFYYSFNSKELTQAQLEIKELKNNLTFELKTNSCIGSTVDAPITGCLVDEKKINQLTKAMETIDLIEETEGDGLERSCDTLIMCIITTLNNGLRNGGGIGDVLRKPSSSVSNFI